MAEYIERESVERNLANIYMGLGGYKTRDAFYKAIDLVHRYPAADVAPVRHGWWNIDGSCSECHGYDNRDLYGSAFCPNCGAKMDLEE